MKGLRKSYKAQFLVDDKWCDNAVRIEVEEECKDYARNKFMLWTTPDDWRVRASEDEPTHTFRDHRLEKIFEYSDLTDDEIDAALEEMVDKMPASVLLAHGDVYSCLREELNNEVLELAKLRRLGRGS